jgi:hypothetical protein
MLHGTSGAMSTRHGPGGLLVDAWLESTGGGGAISGFWALATRSKWQAPTISACDFAEIPEVLQKILCPIVTLTRILGSDATAKDSCRCDDWTEFLQVT